MWPPLAIFLWGTTFLVKIPCYIFVHDPFFLNGRTPLKLNAPKTFMDPPPCFMVGTKQWDRKRPLGCLRSKTRRCVPKRFILVPSLYKTFDLERRSVQLLEYNNIRILLSELSKHCSGSIYKLLCLGGQSTPNVIVCALKSPKIFIIFSRVVHGFRSSWIVYDLGHIQNFSPLLEAGRSLRIFKLISRWLIQCWLMGNFRNGPNFENYYS